jgi:ankyrin repeat protein
LSGDVEIARMLFEHGGGDGVSHALHAAVQSGHHDMARWLLDKGADPNTKNYMDKTTLAVALEMGDEPLASLIRERGGTE